jgi:hypothetical protein
MTDQPDQADVAAWAVLTGRAGNEAPPMAEVLPAGLGANGQRPAEPSDAALLDGVRDGAWLAAQNFPPLVYGVDGLIPEGLTLLVGAPKAGKSWLTLGLLLAVAAGGMALSRVEAAPPRRVFYLALEDGHRRMQDRCRAMLGVPGDDETGGQDEDGEGIPALFSYKTTTTPGAVLHTVGAWLSRHPDTAMVVIDTLAKVMPPAAQGESAYQRDYRIGTALKAIADAHPGLAVMVLHHDRKAAAEDFIDSVSGTHGLAGAADTVIVLCRPRYSPEGLLKITGRDVAEAEYALKTPGGEAWSLDGTDLPGAAASARTREAERSFGEVSAKLLATVRDHPEGVRGADLVPEFGKKVYAYLKRLYDAKRIEKIGRGLYVPLADSPPVQEVKEVEDSQVSDAELCYTAPGALSEVEDSGDGSWSLTGLGPPTPERRARVRATGEENAQGAEAERATRDQHDQARGKRRRPI